MTTMTAEPPVSPRAPKAGARAREAAQRPRLGKYADVAATAGQEAADRQNRAALRTRTSWAQQRLLWDVSSLKRLRACRRVPRSDAGITIRCTVTGPEEWHAGVAGLVHCGSPWACPHCTPFIAAGRRVQIEDLFGAAQERGHGAGFMTLTNSHRAGVPLTVLRAAQTLAWRNTLACAEIKRLREHHGVTGYIQGREIMHGPNGWHPHSHITWLFDQLISGARFFEFGAHFHSVYARKLSEINPAFVSDDQHGLDLQVVDLRDSAGAVSEYLAKFGMEITSVGTKLGRREGHRTPFEIFEEFRTTGNVEFLELWHEFEYATHGKQRLSPSKGLWEFYGVRERTDEDLANVDLSGNDVARVDNGASVHALLPQVEDVLITGQRHGPDGIRAWLTAHGIRWSRPGPKRAGSGPSRVRPGIRVPVYLPTMSSGSRERQARDQHVSPMPGDRDHPRRGGAG